MSVVIEEPTGTAAGYCRWCGHWSKDKRIIAEIHGASGAGGTVVACPGPCELPVRRSEPARTYSL